jgi:hypothetical protein
MNKLSLVGMKLPEKYKENFDVSNEGPSLETSKYSLYFPGSCIPTNESLFIQLEYAYQRVFNCYLGNMQNVA